MVFLLLVLAGSLFLLPVVLFLFIFVAALVDYLRGGGSAATTTGSNADAAPESGASVPMADVPDGVLDLE